MQRKSLDYWELDRICNECDFLIGEPLQDVIVQGSCLYFSFYIEGLYLIAVDLSTSNPFLAVLTQNPPKRSRQDKPISLFLKAHFRGQRLKKMWVEPEWGRVVFFEFEEGVWELRLIPRLVNLIATTGQKCVSWKKIVPLSPSSPPQQNESLRTMQQIAEQWKLLSKKNLPVKRSESSSEELEKKAMKAIANVKKDLAEKMLNSARKAAAWVHANQSLEVPEEYKALIHEDLNLIENCQRLFDLAKKNDRKKLASEERLAQLEKKLDEIKKGTYLKPARESILQAAKLKGRTYLSQKGFRAVFGKNGADNLKLLRHAKAWDLWLHVRDVPGCHAIISRNKNQDLDQDSLREIAIWLVAESFAKKRFQGEQVEFVVAECRFVRPIKGAAAGLVQYKNERFIKVSIP